MFSKFRAWRRKQKPRSARFFEIALRAILINELIQAQTFWEVVFFTEEGQGPFAYRTYQERLLREVLYCDQCCEVDLPHR